MKRTLVLAAILILSCTSVAQQQQNQTRYPKAVYVGPAGPLPFAVCFDWLTSGRKLTGFPRFGF
jgi:hypothetical protein